MKIPPLGKSFYSLFVCLWLAWSAGAQAAAPTISGVWPGTTTPRTPVFVFGSDFSAAVGGSKVSFGGVPAPMVQVIDSTLLIFYIPSGGASQQVCVSTLGGSSCFAPPVCSGLCVTGVWPATVKVGDAAFVFGSGFDPAIGNTKVSLAGTPAPFAHVVNASLIVFFVPPATSGVVSVTTPRGSAVSSVPLIVRRSATFSAAAGSGVEGDAGTTIVPITVSLSNPSPVDISVKVSVTGGTAVEGTDYGLLSTRAWFYAGETSTTLNFYVIGDPLDEDDETVTIAMSPSTDTSIVLGTNQAFTHTIIDNDPPPTVGFGAATSSVRENGVVNIPMTLSSASGKEVTVAYSVTGGSAVSGDYLLEINGSAAAASGTLIFAPGVQTRNITVRAINDSAVEGIETIDLALSGGSNASLGTQVTHRVDVYDYLSPEAFGDTAEITNLASWSCGQKTVTAGCPVSTDTALFQTGTSSIKFHASPATSSLEPAWLRFRPDLSLNWDVSQHGNSQDYIYIEFWLHVKASNKPNPGTLRIGTGNPSDGNYFQFSRSSPSDFPQIFSTAFRALEASDEWTFYRIPLAGDVQWLRTTVGTPSLADIDYVELRADPSGGGGFDAWVDGLRFVRRGTPPAPPAPLTARDPDYPNDPFDPDAIKSKVLVLSFNPILENVAGTPRINAFKGLRDPWTFTQLYINTLFEASRNPNFDANLDLRGSAKARYKIADFLEMDAWPIHTNYTQATDASFVSAPYNHPAIDVVRTVRMLGLADRAMSGEIDEVFWTEYVGTPGEAAMFGEGAFGINGPVIGPPNTTSTRAIPNILPNCLQCLGHRLEHTLKKMFGSSKNTDEAYSYTYSKKEDPLLEGQLKNTLPFGATDTHAWDRFVMIDKQVDRRQSPTPKWIGAIGNAHFPVDARGNYDYRSGADYKLLPDSDTKPAWSVQTNAEDWLAYPDMTCNPRTYNGNTSDLWPSINCKKWGCWEQREYTDASGKIRMSGYQTWLLEHMPHAAGANTGVTCKDSYPLDKGILNNWWRYIMDVDQFKWSDGRFIEDWQPPTVRISAIEQLVFNMRGTTQWVPRHPLLKQDIALPTRVHGHVGVKVKVADENPIYRVDLYMVVDGVGEKYIATDTIRPYTFDWNTTGLLPGTYKLIAKAYDMPNGWEGVSTTTVSVTVDPVAASYTPKLTIATSLGTLHGGETVPGKINQPMSFTLNGDAGSSATYSAQNLPEGATLNTVNGVGQFTWTPAIGQNGAQWIRFITTDAAGNSSAADVVIAVAQ